MKDYTRIYTNCFKQFRKEMKTDLSKTTYNKRIETVINKLSEEDRHILSYYNLGMTIDQIASSIELSHKRTFRKLDIALKHLITPNNVCYITGKKLFKHEGKLLSMYSMTTRCVNSLKRLNILTDNDLIVWLSFHPYQILRIPGIGMNSLPQILTVVYELKNLI